MALAPQVRSAPQCSFLAPSCAPPALLTSVSAQLAVVPGRSVPARGRGAALCQELLSVPLRAALHHLPLAPSSSSPRRRGGAEGSAARHRQRSRQEPLPARAGGGVPLPDGEGVPTSNSPG